ncbi:MAG: hypothetical protein ABI852_22010 [Gemmatimonadaceae bacterium]
MKILCVVALLLSPIALEAQGSARLVGDALQLSSVGMQLSVPAAWLGRKANPPSGLCDDYPSGTVEERVLTRRDQFTVLPSPTGEWKKEFAAVVDSVLPFSALVAHLGGDPWSGSCGAVQMRIYVGDTSITMTTTRMDIAAQVADRYFRSTVEPPVTTLAGWEQRRISWNAFYGDYGGDATVDFLTRRESNRTVVLVFMFQGRAASQRRQRDAILLSWKRIVARE